MNLCAMCIAIIKNQMTVQASSLLQLITAHSMPALYAYTSYFMHFTRGNLYHLVTLFSFISFFIRLPAILSSLFLAINIITSVSVFTL